MKWSTLVGVGIWVVIFFVWYFRTYPEKLRGLIPSGKLAFRWPSRKKPGVSLHKTDKSADRDYRKKVELIESIGSQERFGSSDAATMVKAVHELLHIEPATGQIWEAYALDALESATIVCDDCRVPVRKTVKKTGVRIDCGRCGKWLALKNSKVTVIDPSRPDLEEWEK
jgi:hypothetical protein